MTPAEQTALYLEAADESLAAVRLLVPAGLIRVAVSRLYFAAFYTASALLAARGLTYRRHRAVVGQYGLAFARTRILDPQYAALLNELLLARHEADYELASPPTDSGIPGALERTERFLAAAREFLASQPGR